MPTADRLKGLFNELQTKAETLKRDNPQEYARLLSELAQTLEEFKAELDAALS